MSDRIILTLQVSGFVAALATLFYLHDLGQILFSIAFAVHFIGDVLRLKKDGII